MQKKLKVTFFSSKFGGEILTSGEQIDSKANGRLQSVLRRLAISKTVPTIKVHVYTSKHFIK